MTPPAPHPLPYRLLGAVAGPVILASPHSGRDYPPAFLAQTRLTIAQLRRVEDAYVDELLADAVSAGAQLAAARYGRSFLDLNRAADELDRTMFTDSPIPSRSQPNERVAAGLGILPRLAAHGLEIYGGRLQIAEAEARIAAVHQPWHALLDRLTTEAVLRHGHVVLLDCHSMPTLGAPHGTTAPEFVLGDLHGRSAAPVLVAAIERSLTLDGWRVARNEPYAGGYTTARHGRPAVGIHTVQIEIDRALYMDPARLAPHAGFNRIAATLRRIVEMLLRDSQTLGLAPFAEAAE